ncbi:MAG: vWA domain-containing protein [Myxococcota bacterium]
MSTNPTRRPVWQAGLLVALIAATAWAAGENPRIPTPPTPNPPPVTPPVTTPSETPRVEVAFVLDTTGSMSGLIEGAKQKIWSIANQLASGQPRPEVRMALVGYRDRGDAYVTRVFPLTDDIDAIDAELRAFQAAGGGDTPESVNQALHEAVYHLDWSSDKDVYRVIFLVGDAPPHMDYPNDVPYTKTMAAARKFGIVVNTIQCGGYASTTPIWQEIASVGGGQFAAIRQDGGMLALATPMDEELSRLNAELAGTMVPYGKVEERAELEAKRDAAVAAAPSKAAARLGFLSKLGGRLNAGRKDLVDAIASGSTSLDALEDEALPEPLQELAPAEREAYVKEKQETRQRLQTKIDALSVERDAYVKKEQARRAAEGEGDGFDAEVLETVREQAAKAGIAYE